VRRWRRTRPASAAFVAALAFFLSSLQGPAQEVEVPVDDGGGEPSAEISAGDSTTYEFGGVKLERLPVKFVLSLSGGYDDNPSQASGGSDGSVFSQAALAVSYSFTGPRFSGSLGTSTAFSYYPDRTDNAYRPEAHLQGTLAYAATSRLRITSSWSIRYQDEPDISSNVGSIQQDAKFWHFGASLAVPYQWLPRFSTVTSYSLSGTQFVGDGVDLQSNFTHSFGQQGRFLLLPETVITADYLVSTTMYESNNPGSLSQSALLGIDHTIGPNLRGSLSGGAQFYSTEIFPGFEVNRISPHIQSTFSYALGSTSVTWNSQYSIQPSDFANSAGPTSFRTGLSFSRTLTPRIVATAGGYYRHDEYEGSFFRPAASQNGFDISVGLAYSLHRLLSATAAYERTDFDSGRPGEAFSRNRYSLGLQTTF